jgi:hypothetical protein
MWVGAEPGAMPDACHTYGSYTLCCTRSGPHSMRNACQLPALHQHVGDAPVTV